MHWYRTKVIPKLGSEARHGKKVSAFYNESNSIPLYKRASSKLKERRCCFTPVSESDHLRRTTVKPTALSHPDVKGCTVGYYCFLFFPEDDNKVYVRQFTCKGCSKCDAKKWLECENVATCGPWLEVTMSIPNVSISTISFVMHNFANLHVSFCILMVQVIYCKCICKSFYLVLFFFFIFSILLVGDVPNVKKRCHGIQEAFIKIEVVLIKKRGQKKKLLRKQNEKQKN